MELELEPGGVTELVKSYKTLMDEEFFMDEQRKWFIKMVNNNTPGEDAVKIVEMTRTDSEYYINLVGKAAELED